MSPNNEPTLKAYVFIANFSLQAMDGLKCKESLYSAARASCRSGVFGAANYS